MVFSKINLIWFWEKNKLKILGLSFGFHDSAACIIKNGEILIAEQEDRFTRIKHDSSFPINSINYCLEENNIKIKDIDNIVYYEQDIIKFNRIFNTNLLNFKHLLDITHNWLSRDKFLMKQYIAKKLKYPNHKIFSIKHHKSHASSAFYCSPFTKATVITLDAVGEFETSSIKFGELNKLTDINSVNFPNSIGLLYSAFTSFLGFKVNDGEYKMMGMAGYGKPKYYELIKKFIKINENGTFYLTDRKILNVFDQNKPLYTKEFLKYFGKSRVPNSLFNCNDNNLDIKKKSQHYANIASSIQKATEYWILKIVKSASKITKCNNICMAGGVALNSLANSKIKKNGFNLFVQPAAGDAGGAVGAAMSFYFGKNKRLKPNDFNVYTGKKISVSQIRFELEKFGFYKFKIFKRRANLMKFISEKIYQGKIIALFRGPAELGPRALGNRSILADPRNKNIRNKINSNVKFRELFRPFAPSVISDLASKYFDIKEIYEYDPENFMLSIVNVKKKYRKLLPAITHVDGTARIQLVTKKSNDFFYELINNFNFLSGYPILVNTSFNLRGQPIVGSIRDALNVFSYTQIDFLLIENYLLAKNDYE